MSQSLTPYSIVRPIANSTWDDILLRLQKHVLYDSSSNWDIDLFSSPPEAGLTLTNSTIGNTQLNLRYDSSSGYLFASIDPQGSITDPNDPTSTGSVDVSPESVRAGDANPDFLDEILIFDWIDAIGMVFKSTNNRYTPKWVMMGKVYEPHFANDSNRDIDGLGWYGCSVEVDDDDYFGITSNNDNASEFHTPDGWLNGTTRHYRTSFSGEGFQNIDHPQSFSVETDNYQPLGTAKYAQLMSYQEGDSNSLVTTSSTSGQGFLFGLPTSGSSSNLVIPWDTNVDPGTIANGTKYKGVNESVQSDVLFGFRSDTCGLNGTSGYPLRQSEIGTPNDGQSVDYWSDVAGGQIFWDVSSTYNGPPGGVLLDRSNSDSIELLEHSSTPHTTRLTYSGDLHSSLSLGIRFQHQGSGLSSSGDRQALVATGTIGSGSPSLFFGLEHNGSGVIVRSYLDDGSSTIYDISTGTISLTSSGFDQAFLQHDTSNGTATIEFNHQVDGTPVAQAQDTSVLFPTSSFITPEDHATVGASAGTNHLDAIVQGSIALLRDNKGLQTLPWIDGENLIL